MKIFQIITRTDLGGAQSVVVNLANELCKDHEVIVAAGEGDKKCEIFLLFPNSYGNVLCNIERSRHVLQM